MEQKGSDLFGQNLDDFLTTFYFQRKFFYFWPNFYPRPKFPSLTQIDHSPKLRFWPQFLIKISIFDHIPNFAPILINFRLLTKILIFVQNYDFDHNFWPKCVFLTKISIFDQILLFGHYFDQFSTVDQNFDLWPNSDFWPKFLVFISSQTRRLNFKVVITKFGRFLNWIMWVPTTRVRTEKSSCQ